MADQVITTQWDIDFSASVPKVESFIASANKKFEQSKPNFDINFGKSAEKFEQMRKSASDALETQKLALARFIATGKDSGPAFEKTRTALIASKIEADKFDNALAAVNKQVDGLGGKKITLGSQLKDAFKDSASGGALGSAIAGGLIGGGVAGAVTSVISGIGTAFSEVISLGSEFETGLQSLSAVTGATGPLLATLGDNARELAKQFGGSANEQIGVFQTTLSKIGPQLAKSPEALKTFAENVNTLGKTDSALGAAGAVDALTGSLLQFGVNVNDANEVARESTRFMNVFAASAEVGSASVSSVATSMDIAGGMLNNANISFEEGAAAFQVFASKAIVGEKAGTAMNAVVNKLQLATGPAADKLKKLGVSSEDLGKTLTTKGLGAAMAQFRTAMDKLGSTAEKNALVTQFFGETGASAAQALLGGGEMLAQFTKDVTGTNSATEQAAINMDTFAERMSRAKAGLQDLAIGLFQKIAPIFNGLFEFFDILKNTLGPVFQKTFDAIGGVFTRLWSIAKPILALFAGAVITYIVGAITVGQTVITTFYNIVSKVFDAIVRALQPIKDAFEKVFGSLGGSIDPMKLFTDGLEIMTTVIGEVGGFIADLAGIIIEFATVPLRMIADGVADLINLFGSQSKETKGVATATKDAQTPIQKITAFFDNLRATMAGLTAVAREVGTVFIETFDALKSLDFDKLGELFNGIGDRMTGAFKRAKDAALEKSKQDKEIEAEEKKREEAAAAAEADADAKKDKKSKSAFTLAKEKLKIAKDLAAQELKALEDSLLQQQIDGNLDPKKAAILLDEKRLELGRSILAQTKEIFRTQLDANGRVVKIGVQPAKDENALEQLNEIVTEVQDNLISDKNLQLKLQVKPDVRAALELANEVVKTVEESFKTQAEDVANNFLSPEAFKKSASNLSDTLNAQLAIVREKLNDPLVKADPKLIKDYEAVVKTLEKSLETIEKESFISLQKGRRLREAEEIKLRKENAEKIKDEERKKNELALIAIDESVVNEVIKLEDAAEARNNAINRGIENGSILIYDGLLQQTNLYLDTEAKKDKILADAAKRRLKIIEDEQKKATFAGRAGTALTDLAKNLFKGETEEQVKARKEKKSEIDKELADLSNGFKNKTIQYLDYRKQLAVINKQLDELEGPNVFSAAAEKLKTDALDFASAELTKFKDKAIADFEKMKESGEISFSAIGKIALATFGDGIVDALKAGEIGLQGILKLLGETALTVLEMLAPVISAQYLGFLGIFGLPIALGVIGLLRAALNAAIGDAGAETGVVGIKKGYNKKRGKTDKINLWVAEGESFVTKSGTEKNKPALKLMNKGVDVASYYYEQGRKSTALNRRTRNIKMVFDSQNMIGATVVRETKHVNTVSGADVVTAINGLRSDFNNKPHTTIVNNNMVIPTKAIARESHKQRIKWTRKW